MLLALIFTEQEGKLSHSGGLLIRLYRYIRVPRYEISVLLYQLSEFGFPGLFQLRLWRMPAAS